jgi:hypothetical protein
VLSFGGRKILNNGMLVNMIRSNDEGSREIQVRRERQELTFTITPGRLGTALTNRPLAEP